MTKRLLTLLLLLALAGCPVPGDDNGDPGASPTADPTASPSPATRPTPSPTDEDSVAVCLQGDPFVADGSVEVEGAGGSGDANRISDLRAAAHDGCERFVIDLAAEGGGPAAAAGDVRAEFLRRLGVVRVQLRDVEMVDPVATEASFGGPLARAAYSVWSPQGRWTYVDLHVGDPAEAHVFALENPARVVVDLRPGGGAIPELTGEVNNVVVLEPRPGVASYPLTVSGYSRLFEANTVVRLEVAGEEVVEDFTTATAWADAWGDYSLTIEDGPTGAVTLHVGDYSARDGTWSGAEIELNMR
ncbi:MAG: Gmad2 immunoglobulin-like domain-containing protein [Actinomycetota bacterium]